jgi:hypothetical protein
MVVKTKSGQTPQVETSKRKTSTGTVKLNISDYSIIWDDDWDDEDIRRSNQKIIANYKYALRFKIQSEHQWTYTSLSGISIQKDEIIKYGKAKRFRCTCCGLHAIGIPEDKYSPPRWKMLTTSRDLAEMSCSDILVKDILK